MDAAAARGIDLMIRKLVPVILLAGIVTLPVAAAVPLANDDTDATSVTNGQSTLVAWTSMYPGYSAGFSVYIRLVDSPFDRNAIRLGNGHTPRVATNGRQYLVGYSLGGSRFPPSNPFDNMAVQLVSPEGVLLGPRRFINRSIYGELIAIAWNGKHWLVAYHAASGPPALAHVAYLDESLNVVARLELGMGAMRALTEIDGRWWAIRSDSISAEAVELRPDSTAGARFPTAPLVTPVYVTTHGASRLVLMPSQNANDVDAVPFDPFTGFGERRTFLKGMRVVDIDAYDEGSLLLVAASDQRYDTIFVNADGELAPQLPLFETPPHWPYDSLGSSENGLLLFLTIAGDLYAYGVPPARAPIDPASGRLVSQVRVLDRRRSARH